MASIEQHTEDNCVVYNILSQAAAKPGYQSPLEYLSKLVAQLPQATVDQYLAQSQQIVSSGKYTPEQFAAMLPQYIDPIVQDVKQNRINQAKDKLFAMLERLK